MSSRAWSVFGFVQRGNAHVIFFTRQVASLYQVRQNADTKCQDLDEKILYHISRRRVTLRTESIVSW